MVSTTVHAQFAQTTLTHSAVTVHVYLAMLTVQLAAIPPEIVRFAMRDSNLTVWNAPPVPLIPTPTVPQLVRIAL